MFSFKMSEVNLNKFQEYAYNICEMANQSRSWNIIEAPEACGKTYFADFCNNFPVFDKLIVIDYYGVLSITRDDLYMWKSKNLGLVILCQYGNKPNIYAKLWHFLA